MDIVLIAGLWLPATAWDRTIEHLERLGHRAVAVALPGVDDRTPSATLDDQIDAVLAVADDLERPLVVGHSAASTLAWLVADRRADSVAAIALLGGFPGTPGSTYAEFFPIVDGVMAFPGWEPFAGPDSDDLDESMRAVIADAAVPVAAGVATAVVELHDDRRYDVPVTVICPEFGPSDVQEWIDAGDLPELASSNALRLVDLDSGHWPMFSAPVELAAVIDRIAVS